MFDFGLPAFINIVGEPQRKTLVGLASQRTVSSGDRLHDVGEPVTTMGWVESGTVLFGKYLKSEGFHSLISLGPGHHYGEFGALPIGAGMVTPRRLAAVAEGEVVVNEIEVDRLAPLFRDDPEYLRAFHIVTSARLALMLELYDDARRLPSKQRIINFLGTVQRLQARHRPVECTQADISRVLGLSKVTVNQTLRKLTDDGILTLGYGAISFRDTEQLQALTDRV